MLTSISSRQPSMTPSATQAQLHDLRPERVRCAGCLDGPTSKDPDSTTGQWLSMFLIFGVSSIHHTFEIFG